MIKVTNRGSFANFEAFAGRIKSRTYLTQLGEKYGPMGVALLQGATPVDSGLASQSWYYEVVDRPGYFAIHWGNSDVENGFHVAAMLQYGHGTRQGAWIEGRDYINPVMQPLFDQITNDMWKEVTK